MKVSVFMWLLQCLLTFRSLRWQSLCVQCSNTLNPNSPPLTASLPLSLVILFALELFHSNNITFLTATNTTRSEPQTLSAHMSLSMGALFCL